MWGHNISGKILPGQNMNNKCSLRSNQNYIVLFGEFLSDSNDPGSFNSVLRQHC